MHIKAATSRYANKQHWLSCFSTSRQRDLSITLVSYRIWSSVCGKCHISITDLILISWSCLKINLDICWHYLCKKKKIHCKQSLILALLFHSFVVFPVTIHQHNPRYDQYQRCNNDQLCEMSTGSCNASDNNSHYCKYKND